MSIAPQKEAPIQIEPTKAAIPIVAELSWMRARTSLRVPDSVFGKSRWRSFRTLVSTPWIFSTWPPMKSTSRVNGKTANMRL